MAKPKRETFTHTDIADAVRRFEQRGGIVKRLPPEKVAPRPGYPARLDITAVYEPIGPYDVPPSPHDTGRPIVERRAHPRYEGWQEMSDEFTRLFAADIAIKPKWPRTDDTGFALDMANLGV